MSTYQSNPALLAQLRASGRKVTLDLVGIDGNAFSVLGAFREAGRRHTWPKWTVEELDAVCAEAMAGDYDDLLATIIEFTEAADDEGEDARRTLLRHDDSAWDADERL